MYFEIIIYMKETKCVWHFSIHVGGDDEFKFIPFHSNFIVEGPYDVLDEI